MASDTPLSQSITTKSQIRSCAECRRLKLRCDRIFPCSACIRRGCGNLCPNGTLEKGKRGFLKRLEQALPANGSDSRNGEPSASTEVSVFVSRDTAMVKRIQELENALIERGIEVPGAPRGLRKRRVRSKSNTHKRPRETSISDDGNVSDSSGENPASDIAIGFGTLTIDPKNRSRYIGLSSGSAYLDTDLWGSHEKEDPSLCSTLVDNLEQDLETQVLATLSAFPPYEDAVRLANNYFRHLAFMYNVIPKETFFSIHLPAIYGDNVDKLGTPILQHTVALVAIVLALGIYIDLEKPRTLVPAAELFRVAAFALNNHNVIDGGLRIQTLQGVQALHLMSYYSVNVRDEEGAESAWQMLGLAVRSMQAQGSHMDGSRWNLPLKDLEERRRVFWEVYVFDRLQSFTLGRPSAQNDSHFDCKMPSTCDDPLPSDLDPSDNAWSYTRWHIYKFKWTMLLGRLIDNIFAVKRPTYAALMEYDREISNFYFSLPQWIISPYVVQPVDPLLWNELFPEGPDGTLRYDPYKEGGFKGLGKPEDEKRHAQINSFVTMLFIATLHLHKGPFCRALMMEPRKMLRSQYESNVARVISSSTAIINVVRGMFALYPNLVSRIWHWNFHAFTAAVCQAVFVIVAPFHPLASHTLHSLRCALAFFKQVESRFAQNATVRLSPLVEKASRSMAAFTSQWQSQKDIKKRGTEKASTESGSILQEPESRLYLSGVKNPEDFLGASTKLVRLSEEHTLPRHTAAITPPSSEPSPPRQRETDAEQQHQQLEQSFLASSEDPFVQMMGLYNDTSYLNIDQSYLQQQYASLPQTSQASGEMLSLLQSWIDGTMSQENAIDSLNFGKGTVASSGETYYPVDFESSPSPPSATSQTQTSVSDSMNAHGFDWAVLDQFTNPANLAAI